MALRIREERELIRKGTGTKNSIPDCLDSRTHGPEGSSTIPVPVSMPDDRRPAAAPVSPERGGETRAEKILTGSRLSRSARLRPHNVGDRNGNGRVIGMIVPRACAVRGRRPGARQCRDRHGFWPAGRSTQANSPPSTRTVPPERPAAVRISGQPKPADEKMPLRNTSIEQRLQAGNTMGRLLAICHNGNQFTEFNNPAGVRQVHLPGLFFIRTEIQRPIWPQIKRIHYGVLLDPPLTPNAGAPKFSTCLDLPPGSATETAPRIQKIAYFDCHIAK